MRAINCLDGIFTETASKKTEILQENDGVAHNNFLFFLFFLAGAKQDLNSSYFVVICFLVFK